MGASVLAFRTVRHKYGRPGFPAAGNAFYPTRVSRCVKLSAFTVVDAYKGVPPRWDRFADVVRLAEAVETEDSRPCGSPSTTSNRAGSVPRPVLLAACAARTKRIHLGAMVSVLPFHRPIELAEQYAMVNRLSHRAPEPRCRESIVPSNSRGSGVNTATKRERFDRSLETLLAASTTARSARTRLERSPFGSMSFPVQRPHPPLWIAVQRRKAIRQSRGAAHSLALVPYATVASLSELGDQISEFRTHLPTGRTAEVAVAVHSYIGAGAGTGRRSSRCFGGPASNPEHLLPGESAARPAPRERNDNRRGTAARALRHGPQRSPNGLAGGPPS